VRSIAINGRRIGPGAPVYIIAELSANHHQSFEKAVELVRAAHEAGADAVKLQTYTPDTLTIPCDKEYFRVGQGSLWIGRNLYELYGEAYTPWAWQPRLQEIAVELGLDLFSTPFDATAVEFLEKMRPPAYKIASFEMVDLELIRTVARTGRPMILATGMCRLAEIEDAVRTAREAGAAELALLKCSSAYPAPPEHINLRSIPHLAEAFGVPAGLSDHTLGIAAPVASVALGASIVEKHFTLSRNDPGPDSAFSLEPAEFRDMVAAIRTAERALGEVSYGPTPAEMSSLPFRRSLFVVKDVRVGETFTVENVRSIRPGHGLAPRHLPAILCRRAARDIERGTPLAWALLA
jgi:N-acetylneuraminate synthase